MSQSSMKKRPDFNSREEFYHTRGIKFPANTEAYDSGSLSSDELASMAAEGELRAFHDRRRNEELLDTLFDGEKPTDGMITFARHASESVRTSTDRELTKKVLLTMGPIAYQPGITPELLDSIHTMMNEVYFWGRERLLQQAYDMGAGVKV